MKISLWNYLEKRFSSIYIICSKLPFSHGITIKQFRDVFQRCYFVIAREYILYICWIRYYKEFLVTSTIQTFHKYINLIIVWIFLKFIFIYLLFYKLIYIARKLLHENDQLTTLKTRREKNVRARLITKVKSCQKLKYKLIYRPKILRIKNEWKLPEMKWK